MYCNNGFFIFDSGFFVVVRLKIRYLETFEIFDWLYGDKIILADQNILYILHEVHCTS